MAVLFLPLAVLLGSLLAYQRLGQARLSLLVGWTIIHFAIILSTEILSLFRAVSFWSFLAFWLGVNALFLFRLWKRKQQSPLRFPSRQFSSLTRGERAMVGMATFIILCTFLSGALSPPNNWDSMTYRISRVEHWIQYRSVHSFPTQISRQVELGPGAGFTLLHIQLLSGTFRLHFLAQWLAGGIGALAVSLIAQSMGGDRRTQLVAAALVWTVPMAVLQASSTQDDLTVGAWVTTFAVFAGHLRRSAAFPNFKWAALCGMALGTGMVTKGTMYFFAFPFCIWIAIVAIRTFGGRWVNALAILCILVGALNYGFISRNAYIFGNPFGDVQRTSITNEAKGPGVLWSNVVRGVAVNLALPIDLVNHSLELASKNLHEPLGLRSNDRATTFIYQRFDLRKRFESPTWLFHEDWASNPLHIILSLLALSMGLIRWREGSGPYALCVVGGGLFFCLILRYQPWITRLQLPFFILCCPLIARIDQGRRFQLPLALILLIAAIPAALGNDLRPVVGRRSVLLINDDWKLFTSRQERRKSYREAVETLIEEKAETVALITIDDSWEWPLRYYYYDEGEPLPWFCHLAVENRTAKLYERPPWSGVEYDAIVLIDRPSTHLNPVLLDCYRQAYSGKGIEVWLRAQVPEKAAVQGD